MKFELPAGNIGDWSVEIAGDLIKLTRKFQGTIMTWMTNESWEMGTHEHYKSGVRGDVLLAGLGLGYDVWIVKDYEKVKSVDVVECEREVIDLVWDHIKNNKSHVIHDRILHYMQTTNKKYDFIFFDIFKNDPEYFPKETKILTEAAREILKPGGEILFWRLQPQVEL